jgi:ABC-type bacteriocin/lantibiotic exporter with double-glycine peptidase domain
MGLKKCHALVLVCGIIFIAAYKIGAWHYFSEPPHLAVEYAASYGGVASGQWGGFVQREEETCGHAALAFFLSGTGFPETEASIIEETGTASMLSLAGMERVFTGRGLKTQSLKVSPEYFKKHPVPAILHFSNQHFVVFLRVENGEPVIFDSAYGQVFVPWKTLLRLFSGYMLYVYQ